MIAESHCAKPKWKYLSRLYTFGKRAICICHKFSASSVSILPFIVDNEDGEI